MVFDTDLPGLLSPLTEVEFLEWMSTDLPGLYLLGSLNRHITVHSQQCRAINLIHALKKDRQLDGKSLAIVGAGFAGLTAAAFALEKTNAAVTLFDAAPRPLWIQDCCANRWLHPGIYDWPLPGSLEPCTALPVLNWRAGTAADVAREVRAEWERIAAAKGKLSRRFEARVRRVSASPEGKLLVEIAGALPQAFDVVVVAVGFGVERGGRGRIGYWNDADGLDDLEAGSSVLVSGFGDGGLADILRLCLPEIRQDSLIELVRHVPLDCQRQLVEWEERYRGDTAALDQHYSQLRVEPVIKSLLRTKPPIARVTFVGRGPLYSPRSAILNRFLVSQLRQARGKEAFELAKGAVDEASLLDLAGRDLRIKLNDGIEREFHGIVLRLGPQAEYSSIAPLSRWKVGDERRRHWYEMPQSLDRTRVPLWKERAANAAKDELRQDYLANESSSRAWCLVLHALSPSINWSVHARLALGSAFEELDDMNTEPLILCSDDALANEVALKSTVRALCAADIVIADVTGYDPGLLLLLGIRAAVRRGITIACTKQAISRALWQNLPFNLRELNIVTFHDQGRGHEELVGALRAGKAQANAPRYLDLPVYDYVRGGSTERSTTGPQRVLFLRAFDSGSGRGKVTYGGERKLLVEAGIRKALALPKEASIESVIDQVSPQLAGQRLYESIRHWQTCVVDLTWWRPNVLFELGVRLAVRANHTFCLMDRTPEGEKTLRGSRSKLAELLRPFSYQLNTQDFTKAFVLPLPDHVYQTAVRHFRTRQDGSGEQVDTMLVAASSIVPDGDDLQTVDITPLYGRDNRHYAGELRHIVFERLCAAWYYLVNREEPHVARPVDLLDPRCAEMFRRFRLLSSRLKTLLAYRHDLRDQNLRERIEDSEGKATASGAMEMFDLLEAWLTLRRDPPWKGDRVNAPEQDSSGLLDDLNQLKALQSRLKEWNNPICELPLQGVQSDLRRLESMLQRLGRSPT